MINLASRLSQSVTKPVCVCVCVCVFVFVWGRIQSFYYTHVCESECARCHITATKSSAYDLSEIDECLYD